MLTRLDAPDHVLAWKIAGTLVREDFDGLKEEIARALERQAVVAVYADMTEFEDMTLGAVVEDLKVEWSLIDRIDRFHRAAIVTDKGWLRGLAKVWDAVFARPAIRVFPSVEREAAQDWVRERPRDIRSRTPSVYQTVSRLPGAISLVIDGRLHREDVATVVELFERSFAGAEKIDVLVEIKSWGGFSPAVLADPALWSFKLAAMSKIRRYAIVASKDWMRRGAELIDPLVEMEMRQFENGEVDAAWAWLDEGPSPAS